MRSPVRTLIGLAFVLLALPALSIRAQGIDTVLLAPATKGGTATVIADAPVYLLADSSRAPLRIAKEGSVVRVMGRTSEWVNVDFLDPQFGRRMGYIEANKLRFNQEPAVGATASTPATSVATAGAPKEKESGREATAKAPPRNGSPPPERPAATSSTQRLTRGFLFVGGGYQFTKTTATDSGTLSAYAEDGPVLVAYAVGAAPAIAISGAARVFQRLYVGAALSRLRVSVPTLVSATVPHPSFFSQGRQLAFDAPGIEREELAVHLQARVLLPVLSRLDVSAFGGPSIFAVTQSTVSGFTFNDPYPNTTVTLNAVQSAEHHATKVGFNTGAEVFARLSGRIGLGVGLRWAQASVDLPAYAGNSVRLRVGGASASAGLRLEFQ